MADIYCTEKVKTKTGYSRVFKTTPAAQVVTDASNRFVTDTEKTNWNNKAGNAAATTSANGLMSSADKSKLDGITAGANLYSHPSNHPASIITQDASNRFVTDTEKSTWNGKASSTDAQPPYNGLGYGTCSTAAGTAAKVGTLANFKRYTGAIVTIRLTNDNTATSPTLNVNSTGAGDIRYNGAAIDVSVLTAGDHVFQWDGTYWNWLNYISAFKTRTFNIRTNNGAINLYVSPSGNDTTGDGSSAKPFATIGKVLTYYNGLAGVSNVTIWLADGTYTLTSHLDTYIRGQLKIASTNGDKTKVIIKGNYYFSFHGGRLILSAFTRDVSAATSSIPAMLFTSDSEVSDIIITGNVTYSTGIKAQYCNVGINSISISNCKYAVECHSGSVGRFESITGSGNATGYYAYNGLSMVSGNTLTATVLKQEGGGGYIRGI